MMMLRRGFFRNEDSVDLNQLFKIGRTGGAIGEGLGGCGG
jgi:hypothetical protein